MFPLLSKKGSSSPRKASVTRAIFCWRQRERKHVGFFFAKKAQDVHRVVVPATA
jgi:hypothetical protein